MSITVWSGPSIINEAFGSTNWTPPGTWYIGLLSNANISGVYTEVTSVGTNGYARIPVTNSTSLWNQATVGSSPISLTNKTQLEFPESTGIWTLTGTYAGFFDAASGGNLWFFDLLSTSVSVGSSGTTVYFAIGGITVSMAN